MSLHVIYFEHARMLLQLKNIQKRFGGVVAFARAASTLRPVKFIC